VDLTVAPTVPPSPTGIPKLPTSSANDNEKRETRLFMSLVATKSIVDCINSHSYKKH
jgi:hypothetical protein